MILEAYFHAEIFGIQAFKLQASWSYDLERAEFKMTVTFLLNITSIKIKDICQYELLLATSQRYQQV
jgi:hypothetical protein